MGYLERLCCACSFFCVWSLEEMEISFIPICAEPTALIIPAPPLPGGEICDGGCPRTVTPL